MENSRPYVCIWAGQIKANNLGLLVVPVGPKRVRPIIYIAQDQFIKLIILNKKANIFYTSSMENSRPMCAYVREN